MPEHSISISLCMIVRNEEMTIARCLDSVRDIADEIIIVDSGSTDRTKEIVARYTDKIYDFSWIDDFAAARNYAFSMATKEYLLWLDADDVILESDRIKFLTMKKDFDRSIDVVNMPYILAFDALGGPNFTLRRNRLVRRNKGFQWIGAVHEYLAVGGNIVDSDIAIAHKSEQRDSERNLRIYEKRLEQGEEFTPRDLFYFANELNDHKQYRRAIEYYQHFLDTEKGWVEDQISACGKLADIYKSLGDLDHAQTYLYKSFEYDTPRAEFCCRIGFNHLNVGKYHQAAFWYKLATEIEKPINSWGPQIEACWTWLPHLQLCVCYDRLGRHELAYKHNEIARSYRPEDPQVLHNKKYLEGVLRIETEARS
ncbi:glycosyltransferase family 2 protein [Desulfitobacterium sp. THU1]|uniref:glycosyltransferase family 2 protein n=1 Tax=Desulfitobacterium sp. THU1 TaxID=3138072 RepID=UPI00311FAA38